MNTVYRNETLAVPRKALCIALATVFTAPAFAEDDDEVTRLIKPESQISLGAGHISSDNQRFGVYNGLNQEGGVGLFNFNLNRRNDDTGTWLRASGRNLGLSTREARLEHERQGDWGYFIDFSQITRNTPYDIRTGVEGTHTSSQTVPSTSTTPADPTRFKLERQRTQLGFNKFFSPELEFKLVFQNEEKEGRRLYGRGTPSVAEFLAEPVNSTTRQLDAILNFTGEKLQLSGGYYGSFYNNHNPFLQVNGGATAFNSGVVSSSNPLGVPFTNISLQPDNSAHQFHLAGGYQFTRTTRGSFKVARTRAIQNDDFMAVNFYSASNDGANANTSGRTSLGGRLDTTLVHLGLTSRPLPGLFLLGNVRYEERDDKTARAQYVSGLSGTATSPTVTALGGTSSTDGFNEPRSLTNKSGKLEASYQLPLGYSVVGGLDVEQKERSINGVRIVGYRATTDEVTYRLEVKRAMAETLTGSLAYLHSKREGAEYRNLVTLNGSAYPAYSSSYAPATRNGLLQPIYLADRERDKVRLAMDWAPLDALSAQFIIEDAKDNYGAGRGDPDIGVRRGDARLYAMDVVYTLTENWKLTGWASRSTTRMDQATLATPTSSTAVTLWTAGQRNIVDSVAVGFRGKLLSGRAEVGGDYIFANDRFRYRFAKENTGSATLNNLPDINYRQSTVKFFGRYDVSKDWAVRLDYIFDHRRARDWTWTDWSYSDGTRIAQRLEDKVHFIGLSANYRFR